MHPGELAVGAYRVPQTLLSASGFAAKKGRRGKGKESGREGRFRLKILATPPPCRLHYAVRYETSVTVNREALQVC